MIIGIDPSMGCTGLCYGEATAEPRTTTFKIGPGKSSDAETRIGRMDSLAQRISRFCWTKTPRIVLIENYVFSSRTAGKASTGEFGGLLRLRLIELGMPPVEVAPTALKSFVAGRGNANKELVRAASLASWDREFPTHDECDAHGLWQIGRHWEAILYDRTEGLTRFRLDIAQRECAEWSRRHMRRSKPFIQ